MLSIVAAVSLTNYTAMPFMLLTIRSSLQGWAAVGWYGHVMIGSAMAFFYVGGTSYLKKVQAKRVKSSEFAAAKKVVVDQPKTPGPMVVPPVEIALEDLKDLKQK